MSTIDTCNVLLATAHSVFSGSGGINSQLAGMALQPALPSIETILTLSAPLEVYEKTANVRYPVISIYCARLRNTQMEKFRVFSGNALLVVEIRYQVQMPPAWRPVSIRMSKQRVRCSITHAERGPTSGLIPVPTT